jgi:hypothetical protein
LLDRIEQDCFPIGVDASGPVGERERSKRQFHLTDPPSADNAA